MVTVLNNLIESRAAGTRALRMFVIALTALLFFSCQAFGQQPTAEKLSLDQALQNAIEKNNSLENAAIDENKVKNEIENAKSFRYPQFSLDVGGAYPLVPLTFRFKEGQFGNFPSIGNVPAVDVKISQPRSFTAVIIAQAQQPISQLYRINLGVKQLKVKSEISKETTRARRLEVIDNVKQAYYAILRNQAAATALEEAEKTLKELDRVTENFFRYQVVLRSETLEAKTRLLKTQTELNALRNLLMTQKEQLNFLMNRDIATPFEVIEVPPITICETDLAAARTRALEQRPEIKQAKLAIRLADLEVKVKKADKIPDLGVGVSYFSPQNFNAVIPKNYSSVSIVFKWDVFNYGRKSRAVENAKYDALKERNNSEDTRNHILIEVGDTFRKLQQSRDTLKAAFMAQETARENMRETVGKFENGAVLTVDVRKTEADLADANNRFQQALLSFWSAKSAFEKALGEEK